ncbi:hypothetical protein AAHE18_06G159400 [Arachis hypogaea]
MNKLRRMLRGLVLVLLARHSIFDALSKTQYIRPFYMNPQLSHLPQMPRTSHMWYVPRKNIFSK